MTNDILVEKYRPESIKDICGQKHIMKDFTKFVGNKSIPHLLLYGLAGIGKTLTAIALAKDILGETFSVNFLELNASDARKIDDVRTTVKQYTKQAPVQANFRIILLDEVDNMGKDAQMALKRIMEKYAGTCRFILTCNRIHKLDSAIISRCSTYNFHQLSKDEVALILKKICNNEDFKYSDEALFYIAESTNGDVRRAIMRLQSIASTGEISMDAIYNDKLEGNFLQAINCILNEKNWLAARQSIQKYIVEGGEIRDFLLRLNNYVINKKLLSIDKIGKLCRILREADKNLLLGLSEQLEIDAMLFDILEILSL